MFCKNVYESLMDLGSTIHIIVSKIKECIKSGNWFQFFFQQKQIFLNANAFDGKTNHIKNSKVWNAKSKD
jgi:hypothetical protein